MAYDSRVDTHQHISEVRYRLSDVISHLLDRAKVHDQSKLESPERELFDEIGPTLAKTTYGSDEYKELLRRLDPGLQHHYARNRHHPEHFANGIDDMNLIDLVEMLCDWKAASLRHNDGNILKSIDHNQSRFRYGDQLKRILVNTVRDLGY